MTNVLLWRLLASLFLVCGVGCKVWVEENRERRRRRRRNFWEVHSSGDFKFTLQKDTTNFVAESTAKPPTVVDLLRTTAA